MGVLDKFLDAIKLNDDYDDDLDESLLDDAEEEDDLDEDLSDKPKKSFFQKFSKKEESDDYDDDFSEEETSQASKSTLKTAVPKEKPVYKAEKPVRTAPSKITPMRSSKKSSMSPSMEVCVIKPSSMEDTREIADTLVDNSTVILNLEGIDVELAQRIIDFTSGACYSLGGSLQKVSSYIFVLGPSTVDITGDLQNILGGSVPSIRAGY